MGKEEKVIFGDPVLDDFRNFLYIVWEHLNLPSPTPVQYDIAEYLQNGPKRRIIQAFRGVGKSWVTSAFVCWNLLRDPQLNIMVVSASKTRADDFSTFVQRLIREMPVLEHLKPRTDQRDSKVAFDVGPAEADHAPSVKSIGITGQLAGSRADIIIADDVEVPSNSMTQMMRDKLSEAVKEFDAVLKPNGQVIYLGTPQCEMSLYRELPQRGYEIRIWPACYPDVNRPYVAPMVLEDLYRNPTLSNDVGILPGAPVDTRFREQDLIERMSSYGRSGFALQFMLDTSLSDMERYPLRLSDLVVMDLDGEVGPEKVVWASGREQVLSDVPNVGMNNDHFHKPMATTGDFVPYTGSVMAIDPAGRGKDETSWVVIKIINSQLFLLESKGLLGGYEEETLKKIAESARRWKVNRIIVESNFGDGMFERLLQPVLGKVYPCTVEEVKHSKQKEARIIDTLEPVMNQHRLIVNKKVIEDDWKSIQKYPGEVRDKYSLFYQMTRITREKGALVRDDRLDALSIGVNYWTEMMSRDIEQAMKDAKEERLQAALQSWFKDEVGGYQENNQWRAPHRR